MIKQVKTATKYMRVLLQIKEAIMEDEKIIELYWQRSQDAIIQTDKKYGRLCKNISYNILSSKEDSEECVSDTYMAV